MLFHLVQIIFSIVDWLIEAYLVVLFIRMIMDWVFALNRRYYPHGVMRKFIDIIYGLTEPPLRWLRRYIRPIPLGPIYFDTSFLVLYFALIVLRVLI